MATQAVVSNGSQVVGVRVEPVTAAVLAFGGPAASEILRGPAGVGARNAGRAGPLDGRSKDCGYQVEPDPVAMAARYGAKTSVLDWHKRLVCSHCGGREGTKRS